MANSKGKSVDLGALQDSLIVARKKYSADLRALERAQIAHDQSKVELEIATTELKEASRVVLSS